MNKILAKHKAQANVQPSKQEEQEAERVKEIVSWNDSRFYTATHHVLPLPSSQPKLIGVTQQHHIGSLMSLNITPTVSGAEVPIKQDEHPLRCTFCFAYVNPWCKFSENGKKLSCNICSQVSNTPERYYTPLDENNLPIDLEKRPELSHPVYDFEISAEYNAYPFTGNWKVFIIHASGPVLEASLACVIDWVRSRRAALMAKREVTKSLVHRVRKYRREAIQKQNPNWEPTQVDEADKAEEFSQIEALMPKEHFSIVFLGDQVDYLTIVPNGTDTAPVDSADVTSFVIRGLNDFQHFGLDNIWGPPDGQAFTAKEILIPVMKVSDMFLSRLQDVADYTGWSSCEHLDDLENVSSKSLALIGRLGRGYQAYPDVTLVCQLEPRLKPRRTFFSSLPLVNDSAPPRPASDGKTSLPAKLASYLGMNTEPEVQPRPSVRETLLTFAHVQSALSETITTLNLFAFPTGAHDSDPFAAHEVELLAKIGSYRDRYNWQTSGRLHLYPSQSVSDVEIFKEELARTLPTALSPTSDGHYANALIVCRKSAEVDIDFRFTQECEYNDDLCIEYCHNFDE